MTDFGKRRGFLVRQERPFNGGPPLDEVGARFVTPNDLFFVRNHGDVPEVDLGTFRLEVRGDVERAWARASIRASTIWMARARVGLVGASSRASATARRMAERMT